MPDDSPPPNGSQPPTIAVDAMGGDHAPAQVVAGAISATASRGMSVVLTGRPSQLRPPGSTAAIVATARLRLRSLPGLLQPGLAVVLPTRPKPTLLVDAGAIADPKPEMLFQFAQLGVAYAQVAFGVEDPLVGLLTIGAEPAKGNKLTLRAHELLIAPLHGGLPIRFTGNIEGSDLLTGKVDVVVTDGFTGNVALKTIEGAGSFATAQLRAAVQGSAGARFGALFQRRALRELAGQMDAETYGLDRQGDRVRLPARGGSGARAHHRKDQGTARLRPPGWPFPAPPVTLPPHPACEDGIRQRAR